MVRQVQPLRISKSGPAASSTTHTPSKPAAMAVSRPLAEIGSTERRRNSPSYNQATKKLIVSSECSPYTENSFSFTKENASSPRTFWQGRELMSDTRDEDTENAPDRSPSPAPLSSTRRASIERLKQAGRVKTSNIFALETKDAYDPTNMPVVERPSSNRPLSQHIANNTFTRFDSLKKENNPLRSPGRLGHKRTDSESAITFRSNPSSPTKQPLQASPSKGVSPSPTKSSLARNSQFGSPLDNIPTASWSDGDERAPTPRALHRHNKSVTFNEAPPELNEYEHPTPEPSVSAASDSREGSWESDDYDQEYSFERGSSDVRDDSFDEDLENADKTPVVLPEDWSRMSPDEARTELVDDGDDVFEGSPGPEMAQFARSMSLNSDGESRPLPPLPGMTKTAGATAVAERAAQAARNLPSPPKRASCSKEDILNMTGRSSLSLQERLKLLAHPPRESERPSSKQSNTSHGMPEEITITNLDTGEMLDVHVDTTEVEDDSVLANLADFANSPPKISRESILRKVRNSKYEFEEDVEDSEINEDESAARPSYEELAKMHPDDPIPSRENSRESSDNFIGSGIHTEQVAQVEIKEEPRDDDAISMADIPAINAQRAETTRSPSRMDDYERQSSVLRHDIGSPSEDGDEYSDDYSSVEPEAESTTLHVHENDCADVDEGKETLQQAMQLLTVKDYSGQQFETPKISTDTGFMGLPAYLSTEDFDFGLKHYITPSPPQSNDNTEQLDLTKNAPILRAPVEIKPVMKDLPRPTYDGAEFSPPGTPESVIHHSSSEISAIEEHSSLDRQSAFEPPVIPERRATIKTNGQLKARPSATPADLRMMAEQRRLVSAEHPVPAIPQAYQAEIEQITENEIDDDDATTHSSEDNRSTSDSEAPNSVEMEQPQDDKPTKLNLEIPSLDVDGAGDGLDLDQAFDRVIEGQKKGYLMRQNTKVVVASNRNFSNSSRGTISSNDAHNAGSRPNSRGGSFRSAHGSLKNGSAEQYLKTEPWNGKARRESQRQVSASQHNSGPAPPLPGQSSALGVVNEDFAAGTGSLEDEVAEGVERGRLFVKVVSVKNLDLPMPRNERLSFQLTLDNGLHCVTTSNMELGRTAAIGQEFELVVLNDLEFQLTLTTNLPPPPAMHSAIHVSPVKTTKHGKSSSFSRFLSSPKKRAEKERQEREAMEAEQRRIQDEAQRKRASIHPTAWDILHEHVNGADGSFARAYVNLKAHEKQCFGRQLTVDVPCYNEWALEKDSAVVNSIRSKRGNAGPIRRPPYVVGQLELQLLYVPKPAGAADDEMPKSMSSATREMNKASEVKEIMHEDHLSQQGGDCVHWRRRFFRLQGSRLTAYHEHTHQKRAVINLSKASRLVDDKTTLVADPRSGNPSSKSGRRKSAFAEEDEGYQYVEEGFRIRFANGETIDFYADSHGQKDAWMNVLSQVIGRPDVSKKSATWTDLVLAREKLEGANASQALSATEIRDFTKPPAPSRRLSDRKPISKSVPSSPVKNSAAPPDRAAPALPKADVSTRPQTPPMNPRRGHRSRDAVKSMIF